MGKFLRDIRPVLTRSCVTCRDTATAAGNLVLDQTANVPGTNGRPPLPGDYARLAADQNAQWGHPPIIGNRTWRQTNASRYIRAFQSRRSLLTWKIFGRRMDGWTNADHPPKARRETPRHFRSAPIATRPIWIAPARSCRRPGARSRR